jgi:hypothetical protein
MDRTSSRSRTTYVAIDKGFAYVAVILDAWSRRAVGYRSAARSTFARRSPRSTPRSNDGSPAWLRSPFRSRFAIRRAGLSGSLGSPPHPAGPGRLRPAGALINRRKRQKPSRLRAVLALLRPRTHRNTIKIGPKRNGHGEPPSFATLKQTRADPGIRVTLSELWY